MNGINLRCEVEFKEVTENGLRPVRENHSVKGIFRVVGRTKVSHSH